jgi:FdhD protein
MKWIIFQILWQIKKLTNLENGDSNSNSKLNSKSRQIIQFTNSGNYEKSDFVSIEEPLEISVGHGPSDKRVKSPISVTMRTPGKDFELAAGFLFTEGIVSSKEDIVNIRYTEKQDPSQQFDNYLLVDLRSDIQFDENQLSRHFYTASSCGVCGKSAIELVNKQSIYLLNPIAPKFSTGIFYSLPEKLMHLQNEFKHTGGIHAAALFNPAGEIIKVAEDVGRHNALDKLIGLCMKEELLPVRDFGVLVSGRTSFELIQKAWMAGVSLIAGVGAPSSLAIELAEEAGMTLIGFLKESKYNVYSCFERIHEIR